MAKQDTSVKNVATVEQLRTYLEAEGIRRHKIGVFDLDGVCRGKYVDRRKLLSAVENGFGFCSVVLGWDCTDTLYDTSKVAGWHTGYRDAPVRLDLSTLRRIPFEPDTLFLLGNFSGDYAAVCPRTLLGKIVERIRGLGLEPMAALEYEFFMFDETPQSVRAKGYRDLKTFTPDMYGYSVIRNSVHSEFYHELLDTMEAFDCAIEGLHTETGPGVVEAALSYDNAMAAGDKAALFKTFAKVLAQRRNLMATFMAKWNANVPGQSGHIHMSIVDPKTRENLFYAANGPYLMSDLMRHFVAGQVRYLPELLAMACSTINSYRRLVPGMWVPLASNWGIENRTTAIRVIPDGPKAQRSEFRIGAADANPYLVLAAALGAGLLGIEQKLELPPPVEGNAYEKPVVPENALPTTPQAATERFEKSEVAHALFGSTFVEHFAASRYFEVRENQKHVSDWDLARYFEII